MDPKQLYQEVILDHNRKPRNYGRVENATHSAEGLNPLCGDHLWVSLRVADDTLAEIAFEGESCAICKASASMMTGAVKGKPVADADALVERFRTMVTGKADETQAKALGRLAVFAGIKDLPSRVKCAVLPWHTLHAALHQEAAATTEGDADPAAAR
jgi:nitrogen fixation NifU-like protein